MKTNKNLLLKLSLAASCFAMPAYSMNILNKGLEKAQENWKPLAGAVALAGAGYWVYSNYQEKVSAQKEISILHEALSLQRSKFEELLNNLTSKSSEIVTKKMSEFTESFKKDTLELVELLKKENYDKRILLEAYEDNMATIKKLCNFTTEILNNDDLKKFNEFQNITNEMLQKQNNIALKLKK